MAKKTATEKLNETKDLPKIIKVEKLKDLVKYGDKMLIASPLDYNELMRKIPDGFVTTSFEIRSRLARKYGATFTWQMTAGIFINIVANASEERNEQGLNDLVPYWRTLKKDGELNEKYPGGIEHQQIKLEAEGHEIIQKRKRFFVKDYQLKLFTFE